MVSTKATCGHHGIQDRLKAKRVFRKTRLISKLIGNLYFIQLNPMLHLELETTYYKTLVNELLTDISKSLAKVSPPKMIMLSELPSPFQSISNVLSE